MPGSVVAPRSKPAVRVIWVWAGGICRGWIVVWGAGAGYCGTNDGSRRNTGGDAAPTGAAIVSATVSATADVDVAIHIGVPTDVGAVDVGPVDVGAVEVPAAAGTGPGTAAGG